MKSIYEQIDKAVKENGMLPDDFVLENADKPGDKAIVHLGELEGILGKTYATRYDEDALEKALTFMKAQVKKNAKLAVHDFDDNDLGFAVADVKGPLLREIVKNRYDFDPHKLSTLAYSMVMFGMKKETVKLGLALLVMFDFGDDEIVKKHLITLGLYEGFTSYVIAISRNWPSESKNHMFYVYAQKLKGFGKINAMEFLEPVNAEVREWILCHGCRNEVAYGYLGRIAADKCKYIDRLRTGNFNEEEMQGAGDIMAGLLDERFCPGISEIGEPAVVAKLYLDELAKHTVVLSDIANMYDLQSYIVERDNKSAAEDKKKVLEQIERMLSVIPVADRIKQQLADNPKVAIRTAKESKTDISLELLELIKTKFDDYYKFGGYFFDNDKNIDDLLKVCTDNIAGRDIPQGMGNEAVSTDATQIWKMDLVVKRLADYPGKGCEIVDFCINSPFTRWRKSAAATIIRWETINGVNVKKISADIFRSVKKVKKKEIVDSLKKSWNEILEYK